MEVSACCPIPVLSISPEPGEKGAWCCICRVWVGVRCAQPPQG